MRRLALTLVLLVVIYGCTRPPWPSQGMSGQTVLARLAARKDQIASATYRVRWRAQGTEPHAEFILEIAYKKPGRFRVGATGPLGLPAFTAVVIEEQFWFVDHHNGEYVADQLENLDQYEVPLAAFFSGQWRDLFAGGWGGTEQVSYLSPASKRDRYENHSDNAHWSIHWNSGKGAPRRVVVTEHASEGSTVAETWFDQATKDFPYWEMKRLELRGFPGGGRHRWKVLKQSYNVDIPDRFFAPLPEPQSVGDE